MSLKFEKSPITKKISLSWSAFEAYNLCPLQFFHSYILKKKKRGNVFSLYGIAFHNLIAEAYKSLKFTVKLTEKTWKEYIWNEYKMGYKRGMYNHIPEQEVEKMYYKGIEQIPKFLTMIEQENLMKPAHFAELYLSGRYINHRVGAFIDLGIDTDKGTTLIDWKTGKPNKTQFIQLLLYSALYQKIKKKKVDAIGIGYIKEGQIKYQPLTKKFIEKGSQYIYETYQKMTNDLTFKPTKNPYCKYCDLQGKECIEGCDIY